MQSDKSKLLVTNLRVHYLAAHNKVINAINGVTFEIEENESLGIAGESGCGKSTLGSALMRNLEPSARIVNGSIILDDVDILKLGDSDFNKDIRWKKIAMIFQGAMNTLDPVFIIQDQMEEILRSHGDKGNERIELRFL